MSTTHAEITARQVPKNVPIKLRPPLVEALSLLDRRRIDQGVASIGRMDMIRATVREAARTRLDKFAETKVGKVVNIRIKDVDSKKVEARLEKKRKKLGERMATERSDTAKALGNSSAFELAPLLTIRRDHLVLREEVVASLSSIARTDDVKNILDGQSEQEHLLGKVKKSLVATVGMLAAMPVALVATNIFGLAINIAFGIGYIGGLALGVAMFYFSAKEYRQPREDNDKLINTLVAALGDNESLQVALTEKITGPKPEAVIGQLERTV